MRGKKIKLFQDLYERYSKMYLSFASDRPTAIRGLETRLAKTFGTLGDYGVFECFLFHSLLWQRYSEPLKRIETFRLAEKPLPSWSWTAYEGAITYLPIPMGEVLWHPENVLSPFNSAFPAKRMPPGDSGSPYLWARVWRITGGVSFPRQPAPNVVLDSPERQLEYPVACAVLGSGTSRRGSEKRVCYVLLVHPDYSGGGEKVYERVGVAILEERYVALDASPIVGWIR